MHKPFRWLLLVKAWEDSNPRLHPCLRSTAKCRTDVERPVKGLFRLVDGMISAQMRTALVAHDPGCMFISEVEEPVPVGGGRALWLARRAGAWWIGEPPH